VVTINGKNVDIDFSDPKLYTDEYAEENADTEEFKYIKSTPLYKEVKKYIDGGLSADAALNTGVRALVPPIYRAVEEGFNVVVNEDGSQNISNDTIARMTKQYDEIVNSILSGGGVSERSEIVEEQKKINELSKELGMV